jgi:hypothetical protein
MTIDMHKLHDYYHVPVAFVNPRHSFITKEKDIAMQLHE